MVIVKIRLLMIQYQYNYSFMYIISDTFWWYHLHKIRILYGNIHQCWLFLLWSGVGGGKIHVRIGICWRCQLLIIIRTACENDYLFNEGKQKRKINSPLQLPTFAERCCHAALNMLKTWILRVWDWTLWRHRHCALGVMHWQEWWHCLWLQSSRFPKPHPPLHVIFKVLISEVVLAQRTRFIVIRWFLKDWKSARRRRTKRVHNLLNRGSLGQENKLFPSLLVLSQNIATHLRPEPFLVSFSVSFSIAIKVEITEKWLKCYAALAEDNSRRIQLHIVTSLPFAFGTWPRDLSL